VLYFITLINTFLRTKSNYYLFY